MKWYSYSKHDGRVQATSKPVSAVPLEMRPRSFVHSVPLVLEGRQDVAMGVSQLALTL
jgi:hypothetical protein